jgi:hypothetical protein
VFVEIVAATPTDCFQRGDAPLIEAYAEAICLARKAAIELAERGPVINGRLSPWVACMEKAHRGIATLAARLRLAPQQRADARSVARKAHGPTPSIYELMAAEEADDD